MSGQTVDGWNEFLFANLGAAAALMGLLFVAVSINLKQILKVDWLPSRAGESVAFLLNVVLVDCVLLVPGLTTSQYGWAVLALSGGLWLTMSALRLLGGVPSGPWRANFVVAAGLGQLATLPFVACGVTLVTGTGWGLYWNVVGTVLAYVAAVGNGWILMVEILRP